MKFFLAAFYIFLHEPLIITSENIEHIAPQTATNNNPTAYGYGAYINDENPEQGIVSGGWMNKLGNLMLLSEKHNKGIRNIAFSEKLKSYMKPETLKQQKVLSKYFIDQNTPVWDVEAIKKRHKDLVDFALQEWSFNRV